MTDKSHEIHDQLERMLLILQKLINRNIKTENRTSELEADKVVTKETALCKLDVGPINIRMPDTLIAMADTINKLIDVAERIEKGLGNLELRVNSIAHNRAKEAAVDYVYPRR